MGTWGTGNFDDDDTRDWLEEAVLDPLVRFVEDNVSSSDPVRSKEVAAAVEVLAILYGQIEMGPPGLARVTRWRDSYLAAWDALHLGVRPDIGARRLVIESAFSKLIDKSSEYEDLD